MIGIVGPCNINPFQDFFRIHAFCLSYLSYPLRSERVLCIQNNARAIQTALINRLLDIDSQLETDLRLSRTECSVEFCYRLGLDPASQQFVQIFAAG